MTDGRGKSKKEKRFEKAKGRLQQSFPVRQFVRRSSAVEIAQSIFRQFAEDIQLKDLLAKAETFVAGPKEASPAPVVVDVTSASESAKKPGAARPKKAAPKKTLSKKKTKRAPKRKVKTRS